MQRSVSLSRSNIEADQQGKLDGGDKSNDWGWFVEEDEMLTSDEEYETSKIVKDQESEIIDCCEEHEESKEASQNSMYSSSNMVGEEDEVEEYGEEEVYDFGAMLHIGNVQSKKVDYFTDDDNIQMFEEEKPDEKKSFKANVDGQVVSYEKRNRKRNAEFFQLVMNIVPLYRLLKTKSTEGLNLIVKRIGDGLSSFKPQYALYPVVLTIVNVILIDRRNQS
mmetsp:Transcript_2378/g.2714  ORF Transcript_2378/g.2714 Transcript_2378/m.2714 type:complete len:221 (-) Transcript_2378:135-797(-)|eukprot:CAMPEP_0184042302 /NCGR_PEP_ID=MMETSP0955-20130417/66273_1 /TAXON_ID=627963 /ORGANISM="Aplanochytrium sp, Strain PBS07" /LENGTH=220 /DNA_ID=CAMNT_0026333053 /DNA_START=508 /DNA_END=1170 /DNA_ORIENTATION=+